MAAKVARKSPNHKDLLFVTRMLLGDACRLSYQIRPARRTGVQVVEMEYVADLADPLVDIRDVVESFRSSHLMLPDWDQTLRRVVTALSQLPPQAQVDVVLPGLVPNLRLLLTAGLDNVPQVVDMVAAQIAAALEQTRVPGIPAPEDDDWSFAEINAS